MKHCLITYILGGFTSLFLLLFTPSVNKPKFNFEDHYAKNHRTLYAGQIHYSRIPVQYWEHRILMVKALGLNTLSVYIMWNYHEVEEGVFDYSTENKNLPLFLDLAEKHQMKVLFRPGPYVCAQWDFGGFPARLLSIFGLKLRANNEPFLKEVRTYFKSLAPIIKSHMQTDLNPGGSIVMLQIQNQYGFYGGDKNYIEALRKIWFDLEVNVTQYYVEWVYNIQKSHWVGANIGINNALSKDHWNYLRSRFSTQHLFGGEVYSGWFTYWSKNWQKKPLQKFFAEIGLYMHLNQSFTMYMVHGGTNFGLTAGASAMIGLQYDYMPITTTNDFDAPINEQGSRTPKYQRIRQFFSQFISWPITNPPSPIGTMVLNSFTPIIVGSLTANLGAPDINASKKIFPFQSQQLKMFNQGIVVYQTQLTNRTYFFIARVHDFAIVEVDGVFVATLDRSVKYEHNFTVQCAQSQCTMRIVVEAMGHINFNQQMQTDYKGLIDINDILETEFSWNMYKVPIDEKIFSWSKKTTGINETTLLKATIILETEPGDTYLDMSEFTKGYLWVNGHNLGRYWIVGPQFRLFCPGVWFKKGDNQIYILQMLYDQKPHKVLSKDTLK